MLNVSASRFILQRIIHRKCGFINLSRATIHRSYGGGPDYNSGNHKKLHTGILEQALKLAKELENNPNAKEILAAKHKEVDLEMKKLDSQSKKRRLKAVNMDILFGLFHLCNASLMIYMALRL